MKNVEKNEKEAMAMKMRDAMIYSEKLLWQRWMMKNMQICLPIAWYKVRRRMPTTIDSASGVQSDAEPFARR